MRGVGRGWAGFSGSTFTTFDFSGFLGGETRRYGGWNRAPLPRRPLAHHLIVNPPVGLLQPVGQPRAWLPMQELLDEGVVGVAAVDAFGGGEVVGAFELHVGDLLDDVDG